MSKTMMKTLSYIGIAIIFLLIGIFIGKNTNYNFVSKEEKDENKIEKISISTFIISTDDGDSFISSNDINIDNSMISTYREIINSNVIKNKMKQKYPNVKNIELESLENTGIINAIYVCDNIDEIECIDINNYYVSQFSDVIVQIYQVDDISILERAKISTEI